MKLFQAMQRYDDTELLQYLKGIEKDRKHRVVIDESCEWSTTSLQYAFSSRKSEKVILKLMDIGGKELVMKKINGSNALDFAWNKENFSFDVFSKFFELGGRELIMMKNEKKETPLI